MDLPVLAYLDLLCSALIARDQTSLAHLAEHPAAAGLPESVRREVAEFREPGVVRRAAPIHTLHLYYQYVQLSRNVANVAVQRPTAVAPCLPGNQASQMELPLFAA